MLEADLPGRINRYALKDTSENLRETVANDDDADYSQCNREIPADEENAIEQVQY